jgi:hypothetical protein
MSSRFSNQHPVPPIRSMPEPTESAHGRGRWAVVFAVVVGLGVVGAVVAVVVTSVRRDGPSRQEVVAARGASVMPFDLKATTHTFDPTETGGVQTVVADDPTDNEQIALIRSHLQEEVKRFRKGDFGDPQSIHGHDMPGVRTLAANAGALEIAYRDLDDGGEIDYASADVTIVTALHDWFAAQLRDHGAHAQTGDHKSG